MGARRGSQELEQEWATGVGARSGNQVQEPGVGVGARSGGQEWEQEMETTSQSQELEPGGVAKG